VGRTPHIDAHLPPGGRQACWLPLAGEGDVPWAGGGAADVTVLGVPSSGRCETILTSPIFDSSSRLPLALSLTPLSHCGYLSESYRPLPRKRGEPGVSPFLSQRLSSNCSDSRRC
jgi:hypothetical protein